MTVAVFVAARRPALRLALLVVALAVAVGAVPVRRLASGWPPAGAVVVACDVGQGDAIVLPDGDGSAVVVDAGPDPVPVDGCLRRLGVSTVTLLVLTHFHVDHIGGLSGVLRGRQVGGVVLPTFDEPATGRGRRSGRPPLAASVPVAEVGVGWGYRHGRGRPAGDRPDPTADRHPLRPEQQQPGAAGPRARRLVLLPATPRSRSSTTCWPSGSGRGCGPTCSRSPTTARPIRIRSCSTRSIRGWRWSASARTTRTAIRTRRCCAG